MRQHRIACLADFAVYPALMAVMILVIVDNASSVERALALGFVLAGSFLGTLLECLLHRFALREDTRVAEPPDLYEGRRGWIGTATWLSVAAVVFIALQSTSLAVPLIVALGLVGALAGGLLLVQPSAVRQSERNAEESPLVGERR